MATYTVRIELHGVKHEDSVYEKLHTEMDAHNYERTFRDASGTDRFLPRAEYVGDDMEGSAAVATKIRAWAERLHPNGARVIVTKWGDFNVAGDFLPALIFHLRSTIPSVSKCHRTVAADRIRPSEIEAENEARRRQGTLCRKCFPKP